MFTYQLKKLGKYFMFFDRILIIFFITIKICALTSISLASPDQDCSNSSFYIEKINVDLTKESINEARSQAEYEAKLIGFNRLIKRLIIENKKLKFNKIEIASLVDFLKINKEANSDKRYLANFDICFNRNLVINFFRKNKLQYSETYREPIAILPVYKGPRGFVLWDEKDKWYLKWQDALNSIDGLVKLKLARGNFSLNRILTGNILLKSNNDLIKKLINNENTNALIIVVAEPKMIKNGKTYLSTYAKYYNKSGKFQSSIYRNKTSLQTASSFYNVNQSLIEDEVLNIISSIETNWKKNNLIDTSVNNEVDLIIPILKVNSTNLQKQLIFNDKSINVNSTSNFRDKGFIRIKNEIVFYEKKTKNTFDNIKRGSFSSLKKLKYEKNIIVTQKNIDIWPTIIKKIEKLPFVIEVKITSITNNRGRIIVKFMGSKRTFFQAANELNINFKNLNSQQYILKN